MARELGPLAYDTAAELFLILWNEADGTVWDWSSGAFEAWDDAQLDRYARTMTEAGSSGTYFCDVPAGLAAGSYSWVAYDRLQAGTGSGTADYADLQYRVGVGSFQWDGSAVLPLSSVKTDTGNLVTRVGTPADLGGGATVAGNLADIEGQTDDIGAAGAGLTAADDAILAALAALNNLSSAQVSSAVDALLQAYRLNYLLVADVGDFDNVVDPDSVVGHLAHDGSGTGSPGGYNRNLHSLEAIRDRGDSAWATATGFSTLTQADVRSAVGLASANLDTQLDALPTNADLATALAAADDAVLAAVAGLNNLSAAQAQTAAEAALQTYRLNYLLVTDVTDFDQVVDPDSVVGFLAHDGSGTGSPGGYNRTIHSHEAIGNDTLTVRHLSGTAGVVVAPGSKQGYSLADVDGLAYADFMESILAVLFGVAAPSGSTVAFKKRDGTTTKVTVTYGAADGERTGSSIP